MAHNIPENLLYTDDHEWALIEGDVATIGLTDFAQNSLGDIVFVELPEIGSDLDRGSSFGVVESIKSVNDLNTPFTGEVLEHNQELEDAPELLNQDPYKNWILKIKINDQSESSNLMNPAKYLEHCENSQ